jgi:hypothetical protein
MYISKPFNIVYKYNGGPRAAAEPTTPFFTSAYPHLILVLVQATTYISTAPALSISHDVAPFSLTIVNVSYLPLSKP